MPEYRATLRYLRQSPRKVRLLAESLSGLRVPEAESRLRFSVRSAAVPLRKLILSAAANAKELGKVNEEDLVLKSITVGGGPTLKRFRPRAFGRAAPIRRRKSHIAVVLEGSAPAHRRSGPAPSKIVETPVSPPERPEQKGDVSATASVREQEHPKIATPPSVVKERARGFMRRFFQRKSGM